jgi:pimeloyl-ACP methyl ester carboxylesterase
MARRRAVFHEMTWPTTSLVVQLPTTGSVSRVVRLRSEQAVRRRCSASTSRLKKVSWRAVRSGFDLVTSSSEAVHDLDSPFRELESYHIPSLGLTPPPAVSASSEVVIFDQRGHGDSSPLTEEQDTHARWARDVADLWRPACTGRTTACWAIRTAVSSRWNTPPAGPRPGLIWCWWPLRRVQSPDCRGPSLRRRRSPATRRIMAAILRRRGQAPGSPRPLPPVPCALQCRVRRELRRYDLSARVGEIAAPALLLVGSEDPYRRDMEWLAGRLPLF